MSLFRRWLPCEPELVATSLSPENVGFAWVEPLTEQQIVGKLKELVSPNVHAVRTAGYWFKVAPEDSGTARTAADDEKVIMHLHSGHVMGSALPSWPCLQWSPSALLASYAHFLLWIPTVVLRPVPRGKPFPAAILDSLAGQNYLTHTVGFQPQNIFICGGNLAISLVRYLANNAFSLLSLPVPRGLVLVSPSVDWGLTHDGPNSSWRLNVGSDYSVPFFPRIHSESLLGNLPSTWLTRSPGSAQRPSRFPVTFILSGEAEVAGDSIRTLCARLYRDIGNLRGAL
ncbi:hypothetical protein FB451DRAFT_1456801 [Mycena latifolia]|nr:hypothetical protein FB451DRAFT_1456801 [Mycena latifolia]